ncbi:hypothetical protein, partial [Arsenicicoccus cauae]|uniref:hypothetical protein n=1 Tax=Arsenicicoccus cauae TaxID=2663847 RepID=UPI001E32A1C5
PAKRQNNMTLNRPSTKGTSNEVKNLASNFGTLLSSQTSDAHDRLTSVSLDLRRGNHSILRIRAPRVKSASPLAVE